MSSLVTQHPTQQFDAPVAVSTLEEVLATLAHELRQPLSNIEAIAYYLKMIVPQDDVKIQGQLARIRELVEQSNWILSSAISLAGSSSAALPPEVPPVNVPPVNLEEIITESVISSGAATDVRLALDGNLPLVHLNPREGRDLMDSLLLLFRSIAAGAGPVTVTTSARPEGGVLIEIQAPADGSQVVAGSQLALDSAQRVARSHGGTFTVDHPTDGIRGRLMLP